MKSLLFSFLRPYALSENEKNVLHSILHFQARVNKLDGASEHLSSHRLYFPQKIIYSRMSITGAVRVIKGQEVLPDGSTLEEQGITDGSTVNIIIEPDKEIKLIIKHGPKEVNLSVNSSVQVRVLKQQLIDGGTVAFPLLEFRLIICADDNDGIAEDISLLEESLPLHLCGMSDNTTLRIIGGSIMIQLVNQRGHHWYKLFPKTITVKDMKKTILSIGAFFSNTQFLTDIWLFVKHGECYHKLEGEAPNYQTTILFSS